MADTGAKNSMSTVAALAAGGTILLLVSAALGQGVQGPNTFQGGTGGVAPGTLQPGAAAGALNAYGKGPGAAGAVDVFNKGPSLAPADLQGGALKAAPPASPTKAVGAEPPPSPAKSPRDAASVPVGPRGAAYLKSPTKGDPKANLGDIKGVSSCATGKVC